MINIQEHLNQEVRRREHVMPIFPNHHDVVFRLIGELFSLI
ncbi:transposase [Formosimonas limnophila]